MPGRISVSKSGTFLKGNIPVDLELDATRDPAVALALATDAPFPQSIIKLASIKVTASGGANIDFASGQGAVSFSGSGSVSSGLGAYLQPSDVLNDLDPENTILGGLALTAGAARYVALNWGYDIEAAVKGSLGLAGAGTTVKFGASGQSSGLFAVIRAHPEDPGARTALQNLIESWQLPTQIKGPQSLDPGTWVIAEVDGEVAASIGAQFGYDYSWIRNVNLQGLSGDIGLRIQAAAAVTVGFHAAGKYLLIVARESLNPADEIIRVRLSRMRKKGWDFALNAGVSVTGTNELIPEQLDDFIAGVFGVHGAQIVEDLRTFREWVDPSVPLPQKFSEFVSNIAVNRLEAVAGDKIEAARARVAKFLSDWDQLGHKASTFLWSKVRGLSGEHAAEFETALRALASEDDDQIRELVRNSLADVEFLNSAAGQWLVSIVSGGLLSAVLNQEAVEEVRQKSRLALAILDGKVLDELVETAETVLSVAKIRDAVENKSIADLKPWLAEKLERFVGKLPGIPELEQVRQTLAVLDQRAQELFTQAVQALEKTYSASFAFTFASSTTKTALIDASFDFKKNGSLGVLLTAAISGDYRTLLSTSADGVTLGAARFTHGIERRSFLEVNLPHFNNTIERINKSMATMTVIEEDGRLYVYELNANDQVTARRKWQSTVALTARVTHLAASGVRVFVTDGETADSMTYQAQFRQVFRDMHTQQLETLAGALAPTYFPKSFASATEPDRASIREWVTDLDKHADAVANNGTGILGNTLVALDVALPGKVVAAWLEAPEDRRDPAYLQMSRNIQRALRRLIPFCYFDRAGKYVDRDALRGTAAAMLVYAALPVSTAIRRTAGGVLFDQPDDTYWEFNDQRSADQNERFAMIFNPITENNLAFSMEQVRQLLLQVPDLRAFSDDFGRDDINRVRGKAFTESGNDVLTRSLLFAEAETITDCIGAGRRFAKFRRNAAQDPEEALEALAQAGEKLTSTFNSRLEGTLHGGRLFRQLATLVFLEAAKALDPSLRSVVPAARLGITMLRPDAPDSTFPDFLAGKQIARAAVALEQPVVGLP
jgi:hypothetical protein